MTAARAQATRATSGRAIAVPAEGPRRSLVDVVCGRARAHPTRVAIAAPRGTLTYRDLDERSAAFAVRLRDAGAGQGRLVAVCLDRSPELVVALLAVWRTGAAYLPLDPADPPARRARILADSAPVALVTDSAENVAGAHVPVVHYDDASMPSPRSAGRAALRTNDLAYVIYTSGSTGEPKGVMVEHHGLENLVRWHQRAFTVTAHDRATLIASPAFDASVWELWPYLGAGAGVHVPDADLRLEPERLRDWLIREQITVSFVPTPLAHELLQLPWPEHGALRALLTGGDALRSYQPAGFGARLVNNYGPTEATVVTTSGDVPPEPIGLHGVTIAPDIGRAIANVRVSVLDAQLRRVPNGVEGELAISGSGVARGYLRRPGITADRFRPDPFSRRPGARMYLTGDRGRLQEDGTVRFLGRSDDQVKIRGYRVELGEIERALVAHPAVNDCAVVARESGYERELTAFVALGNATVPPESELREFLRTRLPAPMIPRVFTFVRALPRTTSGKIDRAVLAGPPVGLGAAIPLDSDRSAQGPPAARVAASRPLDPSTSLKVAREWCAVLGVAQVEDDDDFFDVGGHSLLASRLVRRLRDALDVDLPVRAIFDAPTFGELVARVSDNPRRVPRLVDGSATVGSDVIERAPASFGQQWLWFLEQLYQGTGAYNVPLALHLLGEVDADALGSAVRDVVERQPALRTRFEESSSDLWQICDASIVDIQMIELDDVVLSSRSLTRLSELASAPFDLRAGPPLRVFWCRYARAESVVLFAMHHIACDAWSNDVILKEFAQCYEAHVRKVDPVLAPVLPGAGAADFARRERQRLASDELQSSVAFWRRALLGAPSALRLPPIEPRSEDHQQHTDSIGGASIITTLTREQRGRVELVKRQLRLTSFIAYFALYQIALWRTLGEKDIVIGAPMTIRDSSSLDETVGFFLNMVPLRVQLEPSEAMRVVVERARQTVLEAFEHVYVPLARIVQEVRPARVPGRTPLFQTAFVHQSTQREAFDLAGVRARRFEVPMPTSKFDLSLTVDESDLDTELRLEYRPELVPVSLAREVLGEYVRLLREPLDLARPIASVVA